MMKKKCDGCYNQEEILKKLKTVLRFLQSHEQAVYIEKEKLISFYEKMATEYESVGDIKEAENCRKEADEYRKTTRYREELEKAIETESSKDFSMIFAYKNLIKEYAEENNFEKARKYQLKIKQLECEAEENGC